MSGNTQKTPIGLSLNRWGKKVANSVMEVLGKSLPATVSKISGSIVTVNYAVSSDQTIPNTEMPTLGSRYYRAPIQPGEKGATLSVDAYLGGMSGLGGGTADLSQRGNLSTSMWVPVGSKDWPSVDPNTNVITGGPSGIQLRSGESGGATIDITSSSITMTVGGNSITIGAGGVTINGSGVTTIDGKVFLTHVHTLVQTGSSDSGPVGP